MNRISTTQRDQLIGLAMGTAVFIAVVWYVLILPLRASYETGDQKLAETREKIEAARRNLRLRDQFQSEFQNSGLKLQQKEEQMAAGDVYRWILRAFDELEASHRISIFNLEAPRVELFGIPPVVPYKAAIFSVSGTAHYHSFGVFLADLENRFPYMRLQELELRPARFVDTGSEDRERLSFKMELSTLIRGAPQVP